MCTYCLFALYTDACLADVLDAVVICVEESYSSTELAILSGYGYKVETLSGQLDA
jgi:hypothetical protein